MGTAHYFGWVPSGTHPPFYNNPCIKCKVRWVPRSLAVPTLGLFVFVVFFSNLYINHYIQLAHGDGYRSPLWVGTERYPSAMSGWLRADVICDAFSTISPQTETNTKINKNAFVRATINVKWSPKQAPGPTVCNAPSSAESLFEKGP